jgi:hypothetical protein
MDGGVGAPLPVLGAIEFGASNLGSSLEQDMLSTVTAVSTGINLLLIIFFISAVFID